MSDSSGELHSVVVPMFNEEDVAAAFVERATSALASLPSFEIIAVDDGSVDGTIDVLSRLAEAHPELRVVKLARRYGQQVAIAAGLDAARGDTVTVIDSDLQDPPEVIPEMVEKWRQGADTVSAVRSSRSGETGFKRLSSRAYLRAMGGLTPIDIRPDVGDFGLMSRRVVDVLRALPEHHRFMRGLLPWVGLERAYVTYDRDPRFAGETKYSFAKMAGLGIDGVLSFSNRPLRLAIWLGFASSLLALLLGVVFIVLRLTTAVAVEGWTSLIVVVLFLGGLQLTVLGVIGEYIGRIFDEVRARPLYLVDRTFGGTSDPDPDIRPSALPPRGEHQ